MPDDCLIVVRRWFPEEEWTLLVCTPDLSAARRSAHRFLNDFNDDDDEGVTAVIVRYEDGSPVWFQQFTADDLEYVASEDRLVYPGQKHLKFNEPFHWTRVERLTPRTDVR